MTGRRLMVHIDEVVIEADPGADLTTLEAEVRTGIAAAYRVGATPAFARSAPLLRTTHAGVSGIGAAIATAAPPRRTP